MSRARWALVVLLFSLACGSSSTPTAPDEPSLPPNQAPPIPQEPAPVIRSMLDRLAAKIASSYRENEELLARNPQFAAFYQQKLAMLAMPDLASQIVDGRRWIEGEASTVAGPLPIGAVFPLESMRDECRDTVAVLEQSVPILVDFLNEPFPTGRLEVWYGFKLGGTGGGGQINITDRTTSDAANTGSIPYDAVLMHEASHSYIGNEALTQFLELYAYNLWLGRSTDPLDWTFTRGWGPTTPSSFGVSGVLDIYAVVGHDVMRQAYRAIAPLRPPYGSPLSAAVIAAFIAQVPEEHREFVKERLGTIIA